MGSGTSLETTVKGSRMQVWRYLKGQTVICVADCPPEGDCGRVADQDIHRQPLAPGPDIRAQQLYSAAAKPLSAAVTDDEELPQINLLRLLSKKPIAHDLAALLVNHRGVLTRKPASHPMLKLRHSHPVAVPFVLNQLVVQLREQRAIIQSGTSECHGGGVCLKDASRTKAADRTVRADSVLIKRQISAHRSPRWCGRCRNSATRPKRRVDAN